MNIDEIGDSKREYLKTILENTTYDDDSKEILSIRIECLMTMKEYEKALNNLTMNYIQDKHRISLGLNYNQSDIKKTLS